MTKFQFVQSIIAEVNMISEHDKGVKNKGHKCSFAL